MRLGLIGILVCLGGFPLTAQKPSARIKIDTDRVIGEINPHMFGNFAEHLGRCVYGGMYDEGNPLSDENGFRKDVMRAVNQLGVSNLRWPGGNFVSGYNWKDGIGPKDARTPRPDHAWGAIESNRFGTDEFLLFCERTGIEPVLCINAGLGSLNEAREWVEYANESRDTAWARERRKNGRDKPWNVKFWGLGNEIDGPWQLGHKTAEEYAAFALEAAKVMRRADPSIRLIANGASNYKEGSDWIGWNRTVLGKLRNDIDYISLHMYIPPRRQESLEDFLSASQTLDERIEITRAQIRMAQSGVTNPRPIGIAFDEWNVCCRTGPGPGRDLEVHKLGLEERYGFEDALAMGVFLNSFLRHADVVRMANLAQLVNALAPIVSNKDGVFLQSIFYPIAEYGKQRGNSALDLLVSSPSAHTAGGKDIAMLDVSGSWDPKRRLVYINVLNRSADTDVPAQLDSVDGRISGNVRVWQMRHDDLRATHDFGRDRTLLPKTSTVPVNTASKTFSYTFPRASLTILSFAPGEAR
ncbi:MAG: alpha-L-arabinofuranosidase C-terminal domain-containing protein [Bryobacteraceae bacterium]|nr:alpha-L-arabinofuranosidase C-terminal domain-containing protein [Bryobacteraceae bacterium]